MFNKFISYLERTALVVFLANTARKIILPGFRKMPLYDVAGFFYRGMVEGALPMRASAVSFSFFLALFPTIIFIFTLIPYIPIDNFQERLLSLMAEFMPGNAYRAAEGTIMDIVTNQRGGLLSIGFITALYFSTNGFNALITAFNATYHDIETRSPFQQRLVSIFLVLVSTFLLTLAISFIIFSELALNYIFEKGQLLYNLIMIGRWAILFGLFYSLISFTYFLGPSRKTKWRFASAGSMVATVLSILMSLGFAWYVNHFDQYNKLYGSIGTLIVVLLWIYFNSLVVLLGFELNASIHQAQQQKLP